MGMTEEKAQELLEAIRKKGNEWMHIKSYLDELRSSIDNAMKDWSGAAALKLVDNFQLNDTNSFKFKFFGSPCTLSLEVAIDGESKFYVKLQFTRVRDGEDEPFYFAMYVDRRLGDASGVYPAEKREDAVDIMFSAAAKQYMVFYREKSGR